ncbi:efflux RND transporter permease subunit [Candidatus Marithrix sp. Canyon 246]|uniref:efflux RND transporter permease subunit n=2 Tax=Candidatus Marithrix sp. Canyon 246 TaxID=1827136 RepID=UPI000849FA8B|nr:efflux RND transporter permease subunit [Candidatus Marithrix sp. Canyon 246]
MIERYGQLMIKWRYLVIFACLVLVGLTTLGFPLRFDTDYRVFFSDNNPQLLAFDELEKTYTQNDNVMLVLAPKSGQVFSNETLEAVEWLTNEAWQIPFSIRVDSITNFQYTRAEEDDLIVEDLIMEAKTLSEADLTKAKAIALKEPMLIHKLISPKAHVTAVNVTIQLLGKNPDKEIPEIATFVRNLADKLRAKYPNIEIYLTGMTMMNNSFPEAVKKDMTSLIPMMYLVIILMIWLLLGSLSATFSTIIVISCSILGAMGIAGLLGIALSGPSAAAPTMIMTLAVADSIHFLVTLRHEMRVNGLEKYAAIIESLRINILPIFLTSVTTAIGFLSMNFSDVPPFHDLGNIVAMGVIIAFILSVTVLPALIAILPFKPKPETTNTVHAMDRLGEFVVKRRKPLMWTMAGTIILLISFIPRNELNDEFVKYFDETFEFRRATDFVTENLTGIYDIHYSLESGESGGISNPAFLAKVEEFAQWYRQQPEVVHVNSITDTFKRLNKNMHGDDPSYYRLPEQRNLAAQYLLLYEMSLPYGLDINNQINIDKSATRFAVTLQNISTNQMLAVDERAQKWLKDNAPESMQVYGASSAMMFANIGSRNIKNMLLGAVIALILISLILIIALRSVKYGLISLIPNLVPTAMAFGVWGFFVGQIGLGLSVVAGLTIGIVVDDTIHYLTKYLRARREKGLDSTEAVRYAFRSVGLALWITSIVLIAGFLVLSQSHFYMNESMGMMTAVTIALALAADFLFLPTLLMKLEKQ